MRSAVPSGAQVRPFLFGFVCLLLAPFSLPALTTRKNEKTYTDLPRLIFH